MSMFVFLKTHFNVLFAVIILYDLWFITVSVENIQLNIPCCTEPKEENKMTLTEPSW